MNLRSIAALALAEDAAINPDFEEKHPRGNSTNKGQFRKSEKTIAKLDEADAALQTGDFDLFNLIGNPEAVAPMSAKEQSELDAAVVEESLKPLRDHFAAFRARVASDPDYFAGDVAESAKRNKDFRGFIDDIGKLIAKHQQTIDDWAGRAYRQSDKSVDVRSRDETGERDGVSVNLINESRRRRRIESERRAIDKLEKSLEDALGADYKDLISAANKHSLSPDGQTASSQSPAAEYAAVEAKYKGTPEWMKAPNGEPTNLTEKQWVQVRTPSFKAWFGDWENDPEHASKVIDSNGEPMVVYRGSPEKMGDVFEYGQNFYGGNKGFWFTNSKSGAETYAFNDDTGEKGEVKEVFLNARNIVDLVPLGINTTSRRLCDFVRDIYGIDIGRGSSKAERINDIYERIQDRLYPGSHDGIRLADVGHTYIVKTPTQIKSATANSGAFSPDKESILDSAPVFNPAAFLTYLAGKKKE